MADIFHHFPIRASGQKVFDAVSLPEGLNTWWTKSCSGQPAAGATYELGFGAGYDWRGTVSKCVPAETFELELTRAMEGWLGTRVGFILQPGKAVTQVRFHHTGWPETSENYRVSCFCWAMYLRLLKRYVEKGEVVPFEARLDA